MAPIHFRLADARAAAARLQRRAARARHPRTTSRCGLKYVNNDACYPAIMVIGQLVNQFVDREAPTRTQLRSSSPRPAACAGPRTTPGMLRKGLRTPASRRCRCWRSAPRGSRRTPGFKLSPALVAPRHPGARARRPAADRAAARPPLRADAGQRAGAVPPSGTRSCQEFFTYGGYSPTLRPPDRLQLADRPHRGATSTRCRCATSPRRPRVGLVGEILVKFHPDANNHAVEVIEDEGCEAVLPGLLEFFLHDAVHRRLAARATWASARRPRPRARRSCCG